MSIVRVFISYSSKDGKLAEQTCEFLEKKGKTCWIAPRDIAAGTEYGEEIIKGIEQSDVFVLLFSEASNGSQHVLREVERAVSKKIPIIAFRLDETAPSKSFEYFLLTNQWLDATKRPREMMTELCASIDRLVRESSGKKEKPTEEETEKRSTERHGITLVLSVIAVGIVAIAIILAIKLTGPKEKTEDGQPTQEVLQEASREVKVGSYLRFGAYQPMAAKASEDGKITEDGALLWQVVEQNKESGELILVSSNVIDIKPFDCANSGRFDKDCDGIAYDRTLADSYSEEKMAEFRGSNKWEDSDLRKWLNTAGAVDYGGNPPNDRATDECGNAFFTQEGFLTGFLPEEQELLRKASKKGSLPEGELVSLLSVDEVNRFLSAGTLTLYAKLTEAAIASDETSWYHVYHDNGSIHYLWATKTASEGKKNEVVYVNSEINSETFGKMYAASSGFGIRPCIRLNLTGEEVSVSGEGTAADPYHITDPN